MCIFIVNWYGFFRYLLELFLILTSWSMKESSEWCPYSILGFFKSAVAVGWEHVEVLIGVQGLEVEKGGGVAESPKRAGE